MCRKILAYIGKWENNLKLIMIKRSSRLASRTVTLFRIRGWFCENEPVWRTKEDLKMRVTSKDQKKYQGRWSSLRSIVLVMVKFQKMEFRGWKESETQVMNLNHFISRCLNHGLSWLSWRRFHFATLNTQRFRRSK